MLFIYQICEEKVFFPVYYRQVPQHHVAVPARAEISPKGHTTRTAWPDISALELIIILIHCSKKILCNQLSFFKGLI